MGLGFSGTIMVDNVTLPYTVECAPYFSGHDVRVVISSASLDRKRVRAGARALTDLVVAASAPPITEAITLLRDDPAEYIVKIMVPMKGPVRQYTDALQAYVRDRLTTSTECGSDGQDAAL